MHASRVRSPGWGSFLRTSVKVVSINQNVRAKVRGFLFCLEQAASFQTGHSKRTTIRCGPAPHKELSPLYWTDHCVFCPSPRHIIITTETPPHALLTRCVSWKKTKTPTPACWCLIFPHFLTIPWDLFVYLLLENPLNLKNSSLCLLIPLERWVRLLGRREFVLMIDC